MGTTLGAEDGGSLVTRISEKKDLSSMEEITPMNSD
jgi:hypothetical protein